MNCKICETNVIKIDEALIMSHHKSNLQHCKNCDYLFLENPHWLDEAYNEPINISDTGIIDRNVNLAAKLSVLIYFFFDKKKNFLDASGGYGILTRLMRDHGFNFLWSDKYCENIFAKGFEYTSEKVSSLELVTLFEVLEHVEEPLEFIKELFEKKNTKTLVFSTCLFPNGNPPKLDWWYYSFQEGQHISFYSQKTFSTIAKKLELNFYSLGSFFILTKKKIKFYGLKKILFGNLFSNFFRIFLRKFNSSLIMDDHKKLLNKINNRT